MEDNSQLIYANGIGVVEKPSDSKLSLPIHLWTEWKDSKKNRTLGYEVILEKVSDNNWVISSIEEIK